MTRLSILLLLSCDIPAQVEYTKLGPCNDCLENYNSVRGDPTDISPAEKEQQCTPCTACEECPECKEQELSSIDTTFYFWDCECMSKGDIYFCSSPTCARDADEAAVFADKACTLMFSYYSGPPAEWCECVTYPGETCK